MNHTKDLRIIIAYFYFISERGNKRRGIMEEGGDIWWGNWPLVVGLLVPAAIDVTGVICVICVHPRPGICCGC